MPCWKSMWSRWWCTFKELWTELIIFLNVYIADLWLWKNYNIDAEDDCQLCSKWLPNQSVNRIIVAIIVYTDMYEYFDLGPPVNQAAHIDQWALRQSLTIVAMCSYLFKNFKCCGGHVRHSIFANLTATQRATADVAVLVRPRQCIHSEVQGTLLPTIFANPVMRNECKFVLRIWHAPCCDRGGLGFLFTNPKNPNFEKL